MKNCMTKQKNRSKHSLSPSKVSVRCNLNVILYNLNTFNICLCGQVLEDFFSFYSHLYAGDHCQYHMPVLTVRPFSVGPNCQLKAEGAQNPEAVKIHPRQTVEFTLWMSLCVTMRPRHLRRNNEIRAANPVCPVCRENNCWYLCIYF